MTFVIDLPRSRRPNEKRALRSEELTCVRFNGRKLETHRSKISTGEAGDNNRNTGDARNALHIYTVYPTPNKEKVNHTLCPSLSFLHS